MKKLLAFALIAGIPAASSLLSVVNPALAAGPKTITPETTVDFPTNALFGQTRLCAQTNDGQTGKIFIQSQAFHDSERLNLTSKQTCINRQSDGILTDVLHDGGNTKLPINA